LCLWHSERRGSRNPSPSEAKIYKIFFMTQQPMLISWSFPEFVVPERSRNWYIVAILIGVLFLLYAVLTANFLFGLIIIISALIMFLQAHKEAAQVEFAILENGVVVGDKFFDFKSLKNFYLIYEPPRIKNLYLEFDSWWRPRLTIPLEDINPVKVRQILLKFLSEDLTKQTEPLSEALNKKLKI